MVATPPNLSTVRLQLLQICPEFLSPVILLILTHLTALIMIPSRSTRQFFVHWEEDHGGMHTIMFKFEGRIDMLYYFEKSRFIP